MSMKKNGHVFLAMVLLFACAADLSAAEESIDMGQWGSLVIDLPEGWEYAFNDEDSASGPAIRFTPPGGVQLTLLVTPVPFPGGEEDLEAAVLETAGDMARGMRSVAVEDDLPLVKIEGPYCEGLFVSATDGTVQKPTAEEYKYVDQGALAVGPMFVMFTVLHNVGWKGEERLAAISMVEKLRHDAPGEPWRSSGGEVAVAWPGVPWRVALDLPGFDVGYPQVASERATLMLTGYSDDAVMNISVILEETEKRWPAAKWRERSIKRLLGSAAVKEKDVKRRERGEMAILEYMVSEFGGVRVDQKHFNAYLVRDGFWIDVHLSKMQYRERDREKFEKILESIRIEE